MPRDEERDKKLAAALRENLKRRKALARLRAEGSHSVITSSPVEGDPDPIIP